MRWEFPGVFTAGEAADLAGDVGYLDFGDPRLGGVLDLLRGVAPIDTADPAYVRIEQRPQGHPWHFDTGTKGHMGWCRFTAGSLLVPPDRFDGGGFYFRDRGPVFHHLDLLAWDSDEENEHCVTSNSGARVVLLMFFGGADGRLSQDNDPLPAAPPSS